MLAAISTEAGQLSPLRQKQFEALAPLFGENGALNNLEYAKATDILFPSNHVDFNIAIIVLAIYAARRSTSSGRHACSVG
jgi:hypothetical protein